MAPSNGESADQEFKEALEDAIATLHHAYSTNELPRQEATITDLAAILATSSGQEDFRRDVAQICSMLAEQYPSQVKHVAPMLIDQLETSDTETRKHIVRALGYISKPHPDVVRPGVAPLTNLLESDDVGVVRNALWVIANIAEADPTAVNPAIPRFIELLEADNEEICRHAVRAVAAVSETASNDTQDALPQLFELMESTSHYRTVGRALVSIAPTHGEQIVDEFLSRLERGRSVVREHVAWALVPFAKEHPELLWSAWPTLINIVRDDEDHQVQNSIAAALAALATERPDSELIDELIDLLEHKDQFVRRYGCLALGDVAMETQKKAVLRALADARTDDAHLVASQAESLLVDVAAEYPDLVAEVAPDVCDATSGSET